MSTGEVVSPISDMSAHRRRFMGLPSVADRNRVRRNLFGPVDHDETRRFCQRENDRSQRRDSQYYNFDFVNCVPLPGAYKWEKVEHVHHSYALRGMPYCSQHADETAVTLPSTSRTTTEAEHEQQSTATSSTSTISTSSCSSSSSSCGNLVRGETAELPEGACYTPRKGRDAKAAESRPKTRQPNITEYIKQRKRTAPVAKVSSSSSSSVSTASSGATKTKVPKTTSS